MKTCEVAEGTLHQIIGYKKWGPLKVSAILGPEIPVEQNGQSTHIFLEEDVIYDTGVFAEVICSEAVDLYSYSDLGRSAQPLDRLVGHQINKHPLTRDRLRWVKMEGPRVYTEAAQQPGSTL